MEKIFILDSEEAFELAEKFKWELEEKGYKVILKDYGLSGVRIRGEK